jgi:hypothetical protein
MTPRSALAQLRARPGNSPETIALGRLALICDTAARGREGR